MYYISFCFYVSDRISGKYPFFSFRVWSLRLFCILAYTQFIISFLSFMCSAILLPSFISHIWRYRCSFLFLLLKLSNVIAYGAVHTRSVSESVSVSKSVSVSERQRLQAHLFTSPARISARWWARSFKY